MKTIRRSIQQTSIDRKKENQNNQFVFNVLINVYSTCVYPIDCTRTATYTIPTARLYDRTSAIQNVESSDGYMKIDENDNIIEVVKADNGTHTPRHKQRLLYAQQYLLCSIFGL